MQIFIGRSVITELKFIAEALADHFFSVFNSSSSHNAPSSSDCTSLDSLIILCISDSDVK
jgi:hypothetical protein